MGKHGEKDKRIERRRRRRRKGEEEKENR